MNLEQIAAAVGTANFTNGWDAVLAMDVEQINALLAVDYMNAAAAWRTVRVLDATKQYLLDATIGPFFLSFNGSALTFTLQIYYARLVTFTTPSAIMINSVSVVPAGGGTITGTLDLSEVQGSVATQLGSVVISLMDTVFSLNLPTTDCPPSSQFASTIYNYFDNYQIRPTLGTVADGDSTLKPTAFQFTSQSDGEGGGALLIFIKFGGNNGTLGPLSVYPIADGYNATLVLSNQALFQKALVSDYEAWSATASASSGGGWQLTMGEHSSLPGDYVRNGNLAGTTVTCDTTGAAQKLSVPIDGLSLALSGGALTGSWSQSWTQDILCITNIPDPSNPLSTITAQYSTDCEATVTIKGSPAIDTSKAPNNEVTFVGAPSVSASVTNKVPESSPGESLVALICPDIQDALATVLTQAFATLPIPSFSTFAVSNLIFPESHSMVLQDVVTPGDLIAAGTLQGPVTVNPPFVTVATHGIQQFTSENQSMTWSVQSGDASDGTINSSTGVYTAPASIPVNPSVVIIAKDTTNSMLTGNALVTLIPAGEIRISPASALAAPVQNLLVPFSVTDNEGNPCNAIFTVTPPSVGSVTFGANAGQFAFLLKDPANFTSVTIQATVSSTPGAPSGIAHMTITSCVQDSVSVGPNATVPAGGTATLTASSRKNPGSASFAWLVDPPVGTIALVNQADSTKAIYTAPPASSGGSLPSVNVYAYHAESGGSMGVGSATITIKW